jgi:TPP-dependent pyruvate/acetoin dehydrogenase alpha subunit
MLLNKKQRLKILEKASLTRHFENEIFKLIKNKKIIFPVYFSAGQEYISSTIATLFHSKKIKPMLFGQHRSHSIYISFGGDLKKLALEFMGSDKGCSFGMGGSLSIHSDKIKMFGHDGFMGSNLCFGVGASFASKKPSIVFIGDAGIEEDYVLSSISWVAKKKIPILIIVEDNNFAITTTKDERRDWKVKNVANAFDIESYDIKDDPKNIYKILKDYEFKKPMVVNIRTNRLYWHSGAGIDNQNVFDRLKYEISLLGKEGLTIYEKAYKKIQSIFLKINYGNRKN